MVIETVPSAWCSAPGSPGGRGMRTLIAALEKVVGISGEACAVVEAAKDVDRVQRAAVKAGVLVDGKTASFEALPFDPESFNVVVAPDLLGELSMHERVVCLLQAMHLLRPGGRCVVIEKVPRRGLGALFSRRTLDSTYVENGGARGAFEASGRCGSSPTARAGDSTRRQKSSVLRKAQPCADGRVHGAECAPDGAGRRGVPGAGGILIGMSRDIVEHYASGKNDTCPQRRPPSRAESVPSIDKLAQRPTPPAAAPANLF